MGEQEVRALACEAVVDRSRRLGRAAALPGRAVAVGEAAAPPVRARATEEPRLRHVAADVLVYDPQVEGAVEVAACPGTGSAHRQRAVVGVGQVLDHRRGDHAAFRVPPEVGVLRLPVLLHEAAPYVLDVLDGVVDVPADRPEGARRRRVAAERGDQHGQHERIELRPDVRERQVGRKRLQEAGVGSVPVRVDEEPAVPVVRNEDETVRALHGKGVDGLEGQRSGGTDE